MIKIDDRPNASCLYCQYNKAVSEVYNDDYKLEILKEYVLMARIVCASNASLELAGCDVKPRDALLDLESELIAFEQSDD